MSMEERDRALHLQATEQNATGRRQTRSWGEAWTRFSLTESRGTNLPTPGSRTSSLQTVRKQSPV